MYSEYTNTLQTELGQLDIIYITEDGESSVQVWLNKSRIHVPPAWLKQTSQTIARKVCQMHRTGAKLGVRIGGDPEQ